VNSPAQCALSSEFASDGTHLVTLSGDWALAGDQSTRRRLAEVLAAEPANVIVDLRAVTFVDSGLIGALVDGSRAAEARETEFVLVEPGPAISRTLVAGGAYRLPTVTSLEQALTQPGESDGPAHDPEIVERLCLELDAIARRARETRVKLARGDATTGATALFDIENRCRDVLTAARHARRTLTDATAPR
jgi:anti-anti-sigma factor